ncbi:hypothetical protein UUU_03340 (plasmid) [Klebsiella pneumoniae subsp. pneumoniae DSM 30104 = JCM 1662 = NBRC 14940]|nr:hypothetical protein [Klebsiella pneumoniae]EJK88736.1 hypothetical protein UUU_03340 [Klebsiella pneumoniae subsp. pneumoniae DSM 30104 = JCM 1662 = NBRC 14940]KHF67475.1 Multifunctional conjugation protein TraI [Klebsiella pneumoniae]
MEVEILKEAVEYGQSRKWIAHAPLSHPVLEKQAKENTLSAIVDKAIEQVSSKNVRFTYDNVLTNVLNQTEIKKGVYQEARQALDAAVEKGSLIAVDTKQTLFTSAMHVRDEQRLSQICRPYG